MGDRRWWIVSAVGLFMAWLGGCGPTSAGSTDAAGTGCADGSKRCNGLSWEQCIDGEYEVLKVCDLTCTLTGCDIAPADECTVSPDVDGLDAPPSCDETAPPNSFEPEFQWVWEGQGDETESIVTPLVANLTDDNSDGIIDLCDVPDVLVVAGHGVGGLTPGHIYLLDGETGAVHFQVPDVVDSSITPAIGDIDGDGVPEFITMQHGSSLLIAFEHDGTRKWLSDVQWDHPYSGAVALADLDNDGDVEIIAGGHLFDHHGIHQWTAPEAPGQFSATTAADLDGDGDLEVVLGSAAYHHDGTEHYNAPSVFAGYPQVANLDDDPEPEILVTNGQGITLLDHNGAIKYADLRPTGAPPISYTWIRPATVHDFDGDSVADFAMSSSSSYALYNPDATIKWRAPVDDSSGIAAGTAFDFLGDGKAEAMYADQTTMFVFDEQGQPLLEIPRNSGTLSEYPVVADIDNDGSAEIVVVSNANGLFGNPQSPVVQVIRDAEDRWIQARRIWNQHAYHVTNVREDGTIPQYETPSWTQLNTFRTNAQIQEGGVCDPIVQ